MKVEAKLYKGTRDFLPEQMIKRNYVVNIIRGIFECYGFEPLETPTLEMWETLSGKYGEEGDRLTYRFTDRGEREVGLRYDLTVPFSRVMAMYPQLPKPFKRYQIQPVWRADKPQKGRFREFYQCDVDIVGSTLILADAEIMAVISEVLSALKFEAITIRINSRKVLAGIVEASGAGSEREMDVYRSIDKLDKIGRSGVEAELQYRGITDEARQTIMRILAIEGNNEARLEQAREVLGSSESGRLGLLEVEQLLTHLKSYNLRQEVFQFDLTLARGLDYYTGLIFETIMDEPRIGSLTGGGRYDNLIGMFSRQSIPATGSSVGLERIITIMEELDMFPPNLRTSTRVLVTVFDEACLPYSIGIAQLLRRSGINADLYAGKAKLRNQFSLADEKGIPLVIIAGPDEVADGKITVKTMASGEQETIDRAQLTARITAGGQ